MNESVLFGRTLSAGIYWMVYRTGYDNRGFNSSRTLMSEDNKSVRNFEKSGYRNPCGHRIPHKLGT